MISHRLDDVIIGFDGYLMVRPPQAHDHGTLDAVAVHGRQQILGRGDAGIGVGQQRGERGVTLGDLGPAAGERRREDVAVGVDYQGEICTINSEGMSIALRVGTRFVEKEPPPS